MVAHADGGSLWIPALSVDLLGRKCCADFLGKQSADSAFREKIYSTFREKIYAIVMERQILTSVVGNGNLPALHFLLN